MKTIINAGLLERLENIEIALKVIIKKYNDISETQLNYDNYKIYYDENIDNKDLIKICDERSKTVDEICNMRNQLINPVVNLDNDDIDELLDDPEEKFDFEGRINFYLSVNIPEDNEPLPF